MNNSQLLISACPIASDGTLSNCQDTGSQLSNPLAIVINNQNTKAYISVNGSGIYNCDLNQTTGGLSNCTLAYSINYSEGLVLNKDNTRLYLTSFDNSEVIGCVIDQNGGLNSCQATGSNFSSPNGIALDDQNRYAYVANNTGGLSVCRISNYQFIDCQSNSTLQGSLNIVLNNTSTYAYITYYNDVDDNFSARICEIAAATGLLANCRTTATMPSGMLIEGTFGITLNAANTKAYLTNFFSNSFYICEVNAVDGQLFNCRLTADNYNSPRNTALAH